MALRSVGFSLAVVMVCARVEAGELVGDEVPVPALPEQLYRQWVIDPETPKSEPKEYLRTRDDTVERLSLRDAVATALESNPGIAVERLGPRYANAEIERTLGAFDLELSAFANTRDSVTPTSSALSGALTLNEEEKTFGGAVRKLVRTGATLAVEYTSQELENNSRFLGLKPQYKPELTFSVTQPLLRNFGLGLTVLLVRSAEAGSAIAYYDYQARVAALVRQVVEAYWGVVAAGETLKTEKDGFALAQTLQKENEARVRAGVLPAIAVREAAAEAASRDERVILASNALSVAIDRLRLLLQRNPSAAFVPRPIEPADSPEVRDVETDEAAILEKAIQERPEILRARHQVANAQILARVGHNNLLPALDVTGSYGLNGLSGRAVPQEDFRTGETSVTPFSGSYGKSLDRLTSRDFRSYSGGVTFTVPLGNAVAEAEYTQSRIDLRRAELTYRQLLSDVTLEVRKAIGDVRANSKRITATRLARELAEENLEQQKKRYDVGLATTKDLLDFQEKVTGARAAEIRALIDYNVSLAVLRQSEGTLLAQFDVVLEQLPPPSTPLWARF